MAKIDKSQYTKAEWRVIKEQRRKQKEADRARKKALEIERTVTVPVEQKEVKRTVNRSLNSPLDNEEKRFVVCLKHGNKYGPEYVNKLFNMVKRNLNLSHEFVCFTEDPVGINPFIRVEPLPVEMQHASGWWFKPLFFNPNLPLDGTILFMDLDVVIHNNINCLFDYRPGKFMIIRDFNRSLRQDWRKMNSSVFRLNTGQFPWVYDDFLKDTPTHMRRLHGDQDWIYETMYKHKDLWEFWPDEWIQSYKWEMRSRRDLQKIDGVRQFVKKDNPRVHPENRVAVFHGEPYPHQVSDDWVVNHWV